MLKRTSLPISRLALAAFLLCTTGCKKDAPASEAAPSSPLAEDVSAPPKPVTPAATEDALPQLSRADFNRLAVIADLGIYWVDDAENPGHIDASELVELRGAGVYVKDGVLTSAFTPIRVRLVEMRRKEAVTSELNQGRVTLLVSDFSTLTDADRAVMKELAAAGALIDELYSVQTGALALKKQVGAADTASLALFARNSGPECVAANTMGDPFCSAVSTFEKPRSMAYPQDAKVDKAFCDALATQPNKKELLEPFTVIRREGAAFKAVPYTEVYGEYMTPIAALLKKAADALPEDEPAFKAYLLGAAKGFETNVWWEADEAWSKMSAQNSAWYLRIGPDETYFDPCQIKSGFHMSLARVDASALKWQNILTEHRTQMETDLAAVIGAPYVAREVNFKMPEFINIVQNAGDSRNALGATIGQSLPNFGPVAEESRGRTVAMANLYTDADSMRIQKLRAESLFTADTLKAWTKDPSAGRLDTVLHEATHNFGPTGSWKVDGKLPEEVFGGRLDAIMEELKAQTGSYWFLVWLHKKGLVTDEQLHEGFLSSIAWTTGHLARGLFTPTGKPRTYSVLSAIQLKWFMDNGAVRFVGGQETDPGRFEVVYAKVPAAIETLMKTVGGIKARGDKAAGQALVDNATSAAAQRQLQLTLIRERVTRYPKASFAYHVKYE